MAYKIIRAETEHIKTIQNVENVCFSTPWSEESLISELQNGHSTLFAAVEDGEVIGWAGLEAVWGEGSVLNIGVLPEGRRRGIGRALTEALIEEARRLDCESLTLEVRVSNAGAIALYEQLGFISLGIRPRFYEKPREDALMMRKTLKTTEENT